MKAGNFSVNKSTIERGNEKAGEHKIVRRQSRAPRQQSEAPAAQAAATKAATNGAMSPSEAARGVQELVDELGAAGVRNLVDLFGGRGGDRPEHGGSSMEPADVPG